MKKPKVSIIIPIYNVEKYLDKCVSSVINQTLQDIEIILVDDESPDNCPKICDEYAKLDSRIKVIHKKNEGLGFARNSGIDIATGEYVTFLDSDDFVDLNTYEHLYNIINEYKLDIIYYRFKSFTDEENVTIEKFSNEISKYSNENIKDLMLDIIASEPEAKVDHKIQCSSCTAVYKLNIIKKHHIYFHSERELISEDQIFNLDVLLHAKMVGINNTVHYHYRVNKSSLSNTIRTDRILKNHILYKYINDNIAYWDLNKDKCKERNYRLFIGNARSSIQQVMNSKADKNKKNAWLTKQLSLDIWQEIYYSYDWSLLPIYQKLFFFACVKKRINIIRFLCRIKYFFSKYHDK